MFKEWVIDIGISTPEGLVCFIPYRKETDDYLTGMNYLSDSCPGKLVGVIDTLSEDILQWEKNYNLFINKYPDWNERFSKREG